MREQEPNIPIRHVAQERIDSLTPQRRARFEEAATSFSAEVHADDPLLVRQYMEAAAQSFTADMGTLLADSQDAGERLRNKP